MSMNYLNINVRLPILLISVFLLSSCATIGANLALDLAKEEEAKGCESSYYENSAKVALEDCERISRLIKKAGVSGGFVGYDNSGRLILKGSYQNEEQIDLAYMTALTVVGTSSMEISPVTPRDLQEIKMIKSYIPKQNSSGNGEKYALLIGVSKFKYKIPPIVTAVKDAQSIKDTLIKSGEFKDKNIILIKDEQATKQNILNALNDLKNKTTPNDTVVFYISTHGTPPNTFGKMGIIPYDLKNELDDLKNELDYPNMQAYAEKISKDESGDDEIITIVRKRVAALKAAISFDDIQEFVTGIKADKFIAILDTCYSGSALGALSYPVGGIQYAKNERDYFQSLNIESKAELVGNGKVCNNTSYSNSASAGITNKQQLIENPEKKCVSKGSKGLYLTDSLMLGEVAQPNIKKKGNGENYNYEQLEKFKAAFGSSNEQHHFGKIIITAASGDEESQYDSDKVPTSYFTYYLTKGLQNFDGEIYPAFDYARIRTRKVVSDSLENCTQTPEMISTPDACVNIHLSK